MTKKELLKKLENVPDDMEIVLSHTNSWDEHYFRGSFELVRQRVVQGLGDSCSDIYYTDEDEKLYAIREEFPGVPLRYLLALCVY